MKNINKYIGAKWKKGGKSLNTGFDCWSFFKYIQKHEYGLNLPTIKLKEYNYTSSKNEFRENREFQNWEKIDDAKPGCAVIMGRNRIACHIGIYINVGTFRGVLHCLENIGGCLMDKQDLKYTGLKILSYYEYKGKR